MRYEGHTAALSEHPTLTEARAEARNHARQYGESTIHVHDWDGECHTEHVDPDYRAPTPADVKAPHVAP